MSCPHSRIGTPERCSQCLGAPVRRVDQVGATLLVDGQPAGRGVDVETSARRLAYSRRGARATHGRRR